LTIYPFKRLAALWLCTSVLLLSGCGLFTKVKLTEFAQQGHWEGRLQLRILQDKPEQFSFNFDLQGTAEKGELTIYSPLGNTLAVASWTPNSAVLTEGNKQKQFASMEDLTQQLTGAALPLPTLMAWLKTDGPSLEGWQIKSETLPRSRRIFAERTTPLPKLQLTLLLNPPQ
jgi:outer membrane lipoprotein LolB